MTTVYKQGADGSLRFWSIEQTPFGIIMEHGHVGGEVQTQEEIIDEGLAGRSLDEQIESRYNSRLNKKLDAGYVYDIEIAKMGKAKNMLGLCKPMLAQKSEDVDVSLLRKHTLYRQPKLDGNRCLIHNNGSRIVAYTRNGKEITTLDHITSSLDIPVGFTLDGELYCHGESLQTIVSWVKRKQADTARIKYHVYDCVMNAPFSTRYAALRDALEGKVYKDITLVETIAISPDSGANLGGILSDYRDLGYEGGILRSDYTYDRYGKLTPVGYEDGKRSKSLIKLKAWQTEEFEIVDITESADGWGICHCITKSGNKFSVSAPGSHYHKRRMLTHKSEYIGKPLTVEFAFYTAALVPFHPVSVAVRDYE